MSQSNRCSSRRPVIALLLFVLVSATAQAQQQQPTPSDRATGAVQLRVLTYNIHHGEGVDGRLDLERIARVIRSAQPDVVALQEIDQNVSRTGGVDQPAELARLTDMHVVFGANIELQGGHYGNAVLSRLPIRRHVNRLLPNTDGGEQRGALDVELELPDESRHVRLLATHFDHRSRDAQRLDSARAIRDWVAADADRPSILAGDLNDVRGQRVLSELERDWAHTTTEDVATSPSNQPRRQIDFVMFRPAGRWRVVEARVLEEPIASDHRPLLAVLEWRE